MPLYDDVWKSLGTLSLVVSIPKSTWKRLVQDMQVRDGSTQSAHASTAQVHLEAACAGDGGPA